MTINPRLNVGTKPISSRRELLIDAIFTSSFLFFRFSNLIMIQKQVFKTRITKSSTFAFTFIRTLANFKTLVNNNLLSISMETISYVDFVAFYEAVDKHLNIISAKYTKV